jgi:hypothetical protein
MESDDGYAFDRSESLDGISESTGDSWWQIDLGCVA